MAELETIILLVKILDKPKKRRGPLFGGAPYEWFARMEWLFLHFYLVYLKCLSYLPDFFGFAVHFEPF